MGFIKTPGQKKYSFLRGYGLDCLTALYRLTELAFLTLRHILRIAAPKSRGLAQNSSVSSLSHVEYLEALKICNNLSRQPVALQMLILLILLFASNNAVFAQNISDLSATKSSIIKLLSLSNNSCASGLLFNNQIITNSHFAFPLCNSQDCSAISIIASDNQKIELSNSQVKLKKIASGLDLALLEIPQPVSEFPSAAASLSASQKELRVLSYPSCADLKLSEGSFKYSISDLYHLTDLPIRHGSSGGVVYDQNNYIYGIVSESDNLLNALRSTITQSDLSSTRIIPADVLRNFLTLDKQQLFEYQISLLNKFYLEKVIDSEKIERITDSARFLTRVRHLALENLDIGQSKILLAGTNSHLYPLFTYKSIADDSATLLALFASAEKNGFRKSFLKDLTAHEINQIKDRLGSTSDILETVRQKFILNRFQGADFQLLILVAKFAAYLIIIILAGILFAFFILCKKGLSALKKLLSLAALLILTLLCVAIASAGILL